MEFENNAYLTLTLALTVTLTVTLKQDSLKKIDSDPSPGHDPASYSEGVKFAGCRSQVAGQNREDPTTRTATRT